MQTTISSLSGHDPGPNGIKGLESSVEQTKALQLASILLHAWKVRHEGSSSSEVFEELKLVLGNFFDLHLIDHVGETHSYNSRIHEFAHDEERTSMVQIIRPLVVQSQEQSRIIIKALVAAINQEV